MILSILLWLNEPPDLSRSYLVDPGHNHEWVALENSGDFWHHWDRNSIEERTFDQGNFPTLLLRWQYAPSPYPKGYSDVIIAVDCANGSNATVEASVKKELEEVRVDRWTHEKLEFFPLPNLDEPRMQNMMHAVCGEDWVA